MGLFKALNVDALTRWRYAYNTIRDSEAWNQDEELQKLPALDMLLAFEDFSRVSEREYEEKTRRATVEKNSKERKAREGFKVGRRPSSCYRSSSHLRSQELLKELLDQKKIKAKTTWKAVYPDIGNDPRYLTILGNPGSTPLELFWDEVDQLDQIFDPKVEKVEAALKAKDFTIDTKTTKREFDDIVAGAELDGVTQEDLEDIFDFVRIFISNNWFCCSQAQHSSLSKPKGDS
jgi:pre-mRNA-processing factor 40